MAETKVGCCGFPKGMKVYFQEFKLVEVQQTFYNPPQLATAARWRAEAPPDFEFAVKAWQLITHPPTSPTYRRAGIRLPLSEEAYGFFRPREEVMEAWARTLAVARTLQARLVLFQCPASFRPTSENVGNMRQFFSKIERTGLRLVWEPRGAWDQEMVAGLCQELDLVHGVDPFVTAPVAGDLQYFRLHGGPGYRHRYTDAELQWLRGQCRGETYCLFNNLSMYEDARRFSQLLAPGRHQEAG
jgi:uncharacterized protein YecE (DUF72 family)